jgi:NAD(P)H dehydrogenase (quinone)
VQDHWGTEQVLAGSGLSWTALRNNLYAEVILIGLPEAVVRGHVVAAAGDGGAAWVTREDCARVAAAVLGSSDTSNRVIDVTGPSVVGYDEIARLTSELTGEPISYLPLQPTDLRAGVIASGMPELVADLFISFHLGMAQGKFEPATSAVEELTGRRPTSVAEFLSAHRNFLVSRS